MKALVTGCAGFIGSHLVDTLLNIGYNVIGIDCFTDFYPRAIKEENIAGALKNQHFEFIEEDILEMDHFPDVDYVFHLAAQPGVRRSWGSSFEIYTRNNIQAIQQLLEFYESKKIKKFVFASSSSVYGDAELPMKEKGLLKPVSPYGVTKLAGENLCYLYWKNYKVPTVSLRYFTVYGPRQRPDMAIHKLVRAILNGEEFIVYGDGEQTRDFTYVGDVVEATMLAAMCKSSGEVFNIGGGSRISVNELIKLMECALGRKAHIKYAEILRGDVRDTLADTSNTEKMLLWKPGINLKEGLQKYVEWYKNRQ